MQVPIMLFPVAPEGICRAAEPPAAPSENRPGLPVRRQAAPFRTAAAGAEGRAHALGAADGSDTKLLL
jgi:hypothetical protein